MRIVVDLDGVICKLKNPNVSYSNVEPNFDMIRIMKEWKKSGHTLIIYTGRHMRTCNGDVAKVRKKIGPITSQWLKKWDVPYDEIYYGKPYGDLYIDDLALPFTSSGNIANKMDSLKFNFVIPMAGEGRRFKEVGITRPKFMIKVKKKTLFEWSLESLPLDISKSIFFVCLQEHQNKFKINNFIKNIMRQNYRKLDYTIINLPSTTGGQVETVLACKEHINNNRGLIIFNIDTYFNSTRLKSKLLTLKQQKNDGLLGVYKSLDPKLSFIQVGKDGFVKKTAEKQIISEIASTGFYAFSNGSDFVNAAEYMIKNKLKTNNEFYVSELYNQLIKKSKKFIIDFAEEFVPLGTPQDLEIFRTK